MLLIDTNVLIEAMYRYYGAPVCPTIWDWLARRNEAGELASVSQVLDEINEREGPLKIWANRHREGFFLRADRKAERAHGKLAAWCLEAGYGERATARFLRSADSWLVAHAIAGRHTVVTQETRDRSLSQVKIPDACGAHGIECVSCIDMLARKGVRLEVREKRRANPDVPGNVLVEKDVLLHVRYLKFHISSLPSP